MPNIVVQLNVVSKTEEQFYGRFKAQWVKIAKLEMLDGKCLSLTYFKTKLLFQ